MNGNNIEQTLRQAGGRNGGAGAAQGMRPEVMEGAQELSALMREGRLPAGFDIRAACSDPAFADLLMEMPAYAAARVYAAEHRSSAASARNVRQQRLPQMQQAEAGGAVAPNYMDMSTEEFRKLEQALKRGAR